VAEDDLPLPGETQGVAPARPAHRGRHRGQRRVPRSPGRRQRRAYPPRGRPGCTRTGRPLSRGQIGGASLAGPPVVGRCLVIEELAEECWAEAEARVRSGFILLEGIQGVPRACSPLVEEPPTPEAQLACADSHSGSECEIEWEWDGCSGCGSGREGASDGYGAPGAAPEEACALQVELSGCGALEVAASMGELSVDEGPSTCGVPQAALGEAGAQGAPLGSGALEGASEGMEVDRGPGLSGTPEAGWGRQP